MLSTDNATKDPQVNGCEIMLYYVVIIQQNTQIDDKQVFLFVASPKYTPIGHQQSGASHWDTVAQGEHIWGQWILVCTSVNISII